MISQGSQRCRRGEGRGKSLETVDLSLLFLLRERERESRGGRAREEAVILQHSDRKAHRLQG